MFKGQSPRVSGGWERGGGGYPDGLSGEAIPLAARLMAVADVYDALISKRCYKKAFRHLTDQFQRIASEFNDTDPRPMEQL